MKLVSPLNSFENFPIAITLVDLNFQLTNFSKLWLKEFPNSINQDDLSLQKTPTIPEKVKSVTILDSIKRIEKNIGAILDENNVISNINIPKELKVKAVRAYLDSILLNLFTNSVKYKSPKRGLIIEINYKIIDDTIIIYFSDNGQGIDLKRHGEKLFGMYKTFHEHKDAKGIGHFITKNQIEAMNGSIEVESTVDYGTTFILSFKKDNETSIKNVSI